MITTYEFVFEDDDSGELKITPLKDKSVMIQLLDRGGCTYATLNAKEFYSLIGNMLRIQSELRKEGKNGKI